jgi:GR25 family glycosyltransferase involved in LPS biosynthesis
VDFCVVSIREDRKQNVELIESVIDGARHHPDVCDYSNAESRQLFLWNFPEFTYDLYASEPFHNFNPMRKPGEVGCWLSHLSIWEYMIAHSIPEMLVTEDDLNLSAAKFNQIKKEISLARGKELIMLGGWTACYYVTLSGVEKLLAAAPEGFKHHPIDFFMFSCIDDKIVNGSVGPFIVQQDPIFGSHLAFEVADDS